MATSECAEDVQCSPNMRVADCATFWVCKCLQLIYLSALPLTPFWHLYQTLYKNCFSQTSLSWRHHYLPAAWIFVGAMICKRAWQVMGFGSFWRQTGWPCSKHKSSWNWNLVQPNLSLLGIPLCKICRTALTLRWSKLMCWQPSEFPEDLTRANWNAAFISRIELHILWLGWSQIAESTDTWMRQRAWCLVAYPIVSLAGCCQLVPVWYKFTDACGGILLLW